MYSNMHNITENQVQSLAAMARQAALLANKQQAPSPVSGSLADQLRAEAGAALIALGSWIKPRSLAEAHQAAQQRQAGDN